MAKPNGNVVGEYVIWDNGVGKSFKGNLIQIRVIFDLKKPILHTICVDAEDNKEF